MGTLAWPAEPPQLTDGTVCLRAWRDTDVDAVVEACQDPEIQRWTRVPAPFRPEHATGLIHEYAPQVWRSRQGASFAVASVPQDRLLGFCGLVSVDPDNLVASVGYWTAPWARGRRVAQRAVRLLCRWALTEGGLARLELYVEPGNTASVAVAERVGCRLEGVLRSRSLLRGVRRDLALYAFLP